MNKSMTGYGQARFEDETYTISAEVKSLNSKFLDISFRLPRYFNDKEIPLRNYVSEQMGRGKVSITFEFSNKKENTTKVEIDEALFNEYYKKLKHLSGGVESDSNEIFKLAIQFPDVISNIDSENDRDEEWDIIFPVIKEAIASCDDFRVQEGAVLTENLKSYIKSIENNLEEVLKLDPSRIERVKSRLNNNLREFVKREDLDVNRLEQELIYYIEKLDISEEKVRLSSHLNYFMEILNHEESLGKKMSFIAQEIGREINTIGSKANDAAMQKLVVNMKEELEKIKEQVLNIM